ncbi:hypothetical protein D3C78_1338720 [compost metagenome]
MVSSLAERSSVLPSDFDILALPSMPGRRLVSLSMALQWRSTGAGSRLFILWTISLVCSIIGNWSSPTGTTSALNALISAAWLMGYTRKPTGSERAKPFCAISFFTVGLRSTRATVTIFMYSAVSSASAGRADCRQIVVSVGSMPAAR